MDLLWHTDNSMPEDRSKKMKHSIHCQTPQLSSLSPQFRMLGGWSKWRRSLGFSSLSQTTALFLWCSRGPNFPDKPASACACTLFSPSVTLYHSSSLFFLFSQWSAFSLSQRRNRKMEEMRTILLLFFSSPSRKRSRGHYSSKNNFFLHIDIALIRAWPANEMQ